MGKVFLKLRGNSPLFVDMSCLGNDCSRVAAFFCAAGRTSCNDNCEVYGSTDGQNLCYACAASLRNHEFFFKSMNHRKHH
jgi:hypothetical protein